VGIFLGQALCAKSGMAVIKATVKKKNSLRFIPERFIFWIRLLYYAIVLPENQLYHYFNKADLIKRLKAFLSDL
jgi:hypothetical protein